FYFVDQIWQLSDDTISVDSTGIHFQNVRFFNQENPTEFLSLNGELSKKENSRLDLVFNDYLIDTWMPLIEHIGLVFSGKISGRINIFDVFKNIHFDTDLNITDFSINGFDYGIATLKTTPNRQKDGSSVTFDIKDKNKKYLSAIGDFSPSRKNENFNLAISVPELDLSFLKEYVESFSSSLTGKIAGELILEGTLKEPNFHGKLSSNDAVMKVDFLNTVYAISSEKIAFNLNSIEFVSAKLVDTLYKTQGDLSGGLYHTNFKDFRFDVNVQPDRMLVLNTTQMMNEDYFGTAFATGNVHIGGVAQDVFIDVQARTERGTEIMLNHTSKIQVSDDKQFIRFVSSEEEASVNLTQQQPETMSNSSQIVVRLNIEATPDASVSFAMDIPPTVGTINATGNGNLRLNVDSRGGFTMFGDYVLQEGTFDFRFVDQSLGSLITRKFVIERGGTVQWTGDPANMIVNLSAVYSTRASLHPILSADNMSDGGSEDMQRVNVQSVISISGQMEQPTVKFDFQLPNVDENTRTRFFSLLNREDEGELSKQTFSLLLFGGFTPIGNNPALEGSGVNPMAVFSEMLSNQMSNLLQNLSSRIGIDVGVSYKPEDLNISTQTQVSARTQLFDDRIILEGHFGRGGVLRDVSSQQDLTGEVNLEYRATNRFSVRAFNRPVDRTIERPDLGYSQGVGIAYRRNFDSFRALFSRKKKED
ncbi:MAG: translocation/assembly module TamB, partial [Bacteroidales bacterium]|nr:translocation/assembly module TamB [Bacteroidales bacterium]